MPTIAELRGLEILDSRGRPTVKAWCRLASGHEAGASVPSGASTGDAEARECRDGDPRRHAGLGCQKAAGHVSGEISAALAGRSFAAQRDLDAALLALDGTADKRRLGANAVLATSLAFARASALAEGRPLHAYFGSLLATPRPPAMPRLTINLFSGGKHAGGQMQVQDILVVPARAATVADGLEVVCAVYRAAAKLLAERYHTRALKADEGGLAPPFPSTEAALRDAVDAISQAGLRPGQDVMLAVDVAASHFHEDGHYTVDGQRLDAAAMIARVGQWTDRYPIVSVEDGLSQNDWANWPALRARLAPRVLVVGDDLLCTHPARIRRAIESRAATGLLLKVNQIGTLSEAAEAAGLAREAGWQVTVSARSGETEDDWLADLAVAWGDQIKVGSVAQSDRLAKYNRLLEIEAATHYPVVAWPNAPTA